MKPAVEFRDVYKSFKNQEVLRGINLVFPEGNLSVLMGLSGSGKSVMLKHILRLLSPDRGSISILGRDLAVLSSKQMRELLKELGMVFQHSALFDSMSSGENVAFPLREITNLSEEAIREKSERILSLVGLKNAYDKFPSELSGGMQKRVGLARALVSDPKIVLFDEPTTGLDPIMSVVIEDLILETHAKIGYTGIIITHSVETALKVGSQIALLVAGRIRALGTPDDFQHSEDEAVRQFLAKSPNGPIEVL